MTSVVLSGGDLAKAASTVAKLLGSGSMIALEESILLEFVGDCLQITGGNDKSRLTIRQNFEEATGDPTGKCVPGKMFSSIISKLKKSEITLSFGESFIIEADGDRFELGAEEHEGYPFQIPLDEPDQILEFDRNELSDVFDRIGFAIAKKDTAQAISGAMVDIIDGQMKVVAANQSMMAMSTIPISQDFTRKAMVSSYFCELLPKLVRGDGAIKMSVLENAILLDSTEFILVGQQLTRDRLPYDMVLKSTQPAYKISVDRAAFRSALERASLFVGRLTKASKFVFEKDKLTIRCQSRDTGSEAEITVDIDNPGQSIELFFDPTDILGAVKTAQEEIVSLGIVGEHRPIRMEEGPLTFVLSPMLM